MFFHNLKYYIIMLFKNKIMLFWIVIFPIALLTMFFVAFSSITANTESFSEIPVSVVFEGEENAQFKEILEGITADEEPIFAIAYDEKNEAQAKLESGEIDGIIFCNGETLSAGVTSGASIEKTIITSFVQQYSQNVKTITDIATVNPANIQAVIEKMSDEISSVQQQDFTSNNTDFFITYYYGLFAMAALLAAMHGMYCAVNFQANLSKTGARVSASPVKKISLVSASLVASSLFQAAAMTLATVYAMFILKIDFGVDFLVMTAINIVSGTTGVMLGFFVGSIGRMSETLKRTILLGVTMFGSILAGLISPDISYIVRTSAPIVDKINPAKIITDCFYAVNVYGDYNRLLIDLATLGAMCVVFCVGGALISRRRKYASI